MMKAFRSIGVLMSFCRTASAFQNFRLVSGDRWVERFGHFRPATTFGGRVVYFAKQRFSN